MSNLNSDCLVFNSKTASKTPENFSLMEPLISIMLKDSRFAEIVFQFLLHFKTPSSAFLWEKNNEIFKSFIDASSLTDEEIEFYSDEVKSIFESLMGLNPPELNDYRGVLLEEFWDSAIKEKFSEEQLSLIREVIVTTSNSAISIVAEVNSDLDFLYFIEKEKGKLTFIECKADVLSFFARANRKIERSEESLKKIFLMNGLIEKISVRSEISEVSVILASYNTLDEDDYTFITNKLNNALKRTDNEFYKQSIQDFLQKWNDGFISLYGKDKSIVFCK
ncbi:hypothetical protein [Exiguobacterium sp. s191]|uniref:hypothetical protein n=1 Tax=Exiguobacterium sp. s191 TaxID=2751196 RepID=UPI001BE54C94|nr:hypothetical protein [Exiguobacterium sp. s191]